MTSKLNNIRSVHVLYLILLLLVGTVIKFGPWKNAEKPGKLISWDVTSYYGYLPATFIEKDLSLSFVQSDSAYYHERQMYWPEIAPNGKKLIKTTMGMSFLYAPFFAIANFIDDDTSKSRGFSETYEFWLVLSSLFYTIIGMVFLRLFLIKQFSDQITSIILFLIYLGTNLFYYITVEPLMPHAYNLALVSIFLYHTILWHENHNWKNTIIIGFVIGLITLIRPVNFLIILFFLLYNVKRTKDLKLQVDKFLNHKAKLTAVAMIGLFVISPQLIYWKIQTGSFLYNSYSGEQFFFLKPHILDGLFSYRKGWFLYTPLMLFAVIGLFLKHNNRPASTGIFILVTYITFSWWNWWYGGGFGCRPLIDFYPLFALGFGNLLIGVNKINWLKYSSIILGILLVIFNLFQTLQKKSDAIHWDSMTKEAYWHNFLHRYPQPGFENTLQAPNNEAAKEGKNEY